MLMAYVPVLSGDPNARFRAGKDLLFLLGQIVRPHTLVSPSAKQLQNTGCMKLEEGRNL